jgi:hypothetical protein
MIAVMRSVTTESPRIPVPRGILAARSRGSSTAPGRSCGRGAAPCASGRAAWWLALIGVALSAASAQAQIAFRGAASAAVPESSTIAYGGQGAFATRGNCGSINPSLPAGTAAGDLLVALVASGASPTLSMPGWNVLFQHNPVGTLTSAIYWRIATGGDPNTITQSGTCNVLAARISRFTGVDVLSPFMTAPLAGTNWSYQNANTVTTGSETTNYSGAMLVATAHSTDDDTFGALGGFTQAYTSRTTTGNDVAIALYYASQTGPGSAGPYTITKDRGSDPNHGTVFALRAKNTRLTINVPAGTVANDVMIASVTVRPCSSASGGACTMAVTAPAGWTLVDQVDQTTGGGTGGFGNRLFVYRRVAAGAEPASYTWLINGPPAQNGAAGGIVSFSGVDNASPIITSVGQATASSTSHAAPSLDVGTVANAWLLTTHSSNSSSFWTPPAGMTERVDIASLAPPDDLGLSIQINTELLAGTGATGTRTASYAAPAPAADSGATHALALRPAPTLDHFSISHSASGVACEDQTITITAHNASHNPVSANGLTVALSTSNGRGTWTGIVAGGGALSDPTAGDGAATYTFAAGSNSVSLTFRYANLATASETFSFNVSGGGFSESSGSANAGDDPPFTMAQAGFQFRNVTDATTLIPAQIAAKPSNAGFGARTIRLRAIRTDTATGACTGLFGSQSRTVDLGAECNNAASCAGRQVNINGTNIATSNDNGGAGAAAYTGISLAFNASSEADLSITYPDAGRMLLHARYDLDTAVAGFEMTGASNPFAVRPFAFHLSGPGIPGVTGPAGSVFKKAGENFDVTVTAVGWQAGDDANNDGMPDSGANLADNLVLPNFGQETPAESVTLTHTLVAPAGGASGSLTGALFSGFAGGSRTNAMSWSEVGSIALDAALTGGNYLGDGGNAVGTVGPLGRFIPDHFFLAPGATLTNRAALACAPASSFTYLGERLGLSFTLQARNSANAVTQNYGTANGFAKLDPATVAQLGLGALSGTTDLTARIGSPAASGSFVFGAASIGATLAIDRAAAPDGPYVATRIGIAPADSDAVRLRASDYDMDVDGAGGNDHQQVGANTEVRFGRLRSFNASGTTLLDLPLRLETQHYTGTGFVRNSADSCTRLDATAIGIDNATSNLVPIADCKTALRIDSAQIQFQNGQLASGVNLRLLKPGGAYNGSVNLTVNLGAATSVAKTCTSQGPAGYVDATSANLPYLRSNWGSGAFDDDPVSRATFGIYRNADEFIYFREIY